MADSLIFGAGFDFNKGAAIAEKDLEGIVKRLQDRLDSNKLIAKIGFNIDESAKDTIQQISDVIRKSGLSGQTLNVNVNSIGFTELGQAIENLNASLVNLNSLLSNTAESEQKVAQGIDEQGRATANTTNTIQRQLMEQERVNKALRDTYDEQDRVKRLLDQYHDTYEEQVLALVKLERQLKQNKKAQEENERNLDKGLISYEKYIQKQQDLVATQRELTQSKRQLTQIMTAEEKAIMAQEGSYNQLSQQLSLLKKAYKDMSVEGQMSDFGRELENAIQNLDARLKDMAADMGEFQRNVGNYAIAGQNGVVTTESLTAAIAQEAVTMQDLIDQTRILEEGKRMLSVNDAHYAETLSSVNAKLEENRRRLADVSDIMDKTPTSVSEAESQNKRLVEALKQVDLGSEGAKERIRQLNEKIAENTKIIRENTPAIQEQTRAIEQQKKTNEGVASQLLNMIGINANFGESLRGLGKSDAGGVFVALGNKVKAFGKTLMGVVTNPWVLTFLGIAGVGAAFKWWYDFNKGLIEASRLTKNFTGFSGDTADKVTADIQAMADKMGKGFNETIKATNILVHQFGLSWAEAIDLIQKGIVAGADMHGNLLSNIERFAPALRDAGVEASQFMAILAETRSGIFNERGVQDIIRGGTRLRAQTKLISESLDAIGISSKKMQKDLKDGTITMLQAVQQVSARLKELPQNSQEAGNIMRNVFGRTAAEGGMLLLESIADINTNLDTAIERMGEMGELNARQMNAQRELNEVLYSVFKMSDTTFAQMTTRVKIFATEALTEVIKKLADIANWFINLYNETKSVRVNVAQIIFVFEALWEVAKLVLRQLYEAFRALGVVIEGAVHFDPAKIAQGWKQGVAALKNNLVKILQDIGDAAANAFGDRLNERLNNITIGLDANIPGVNSGNNRTGVIETFGGKEDGNDTRLQTLKEIEQVLTTINGKYEELLKKEGQTQSLADIGKIYGDTLEYINTLAKEFNLSFEMPTSFKSLQEYRNAIKGVMEQLKTKGYEKASLELQTKINTADIDKLGEDIEKKLKQLQSRIEQSKTAKEFYDKILSATGDVDIAANVTMSIYGQNENDITENVKKHLEELFGEYNVDIPIIVGTDYIDWNKVRKEAEQALESGAIGIEQYEKIISAVKNGEKDLASVGQEFAKLIMNYDEITQQRVDIEKKYAEDIKKIDEGLALYRQSATKEQIKEMEDRANAAKEALKAEKDLKLLKLSDQYLRYFSAVNTLTLKEAQDLKTKLRAALYNAFRQGKLSASELRKELKAVDEQFNKLVNSAGYLRTYLEGGFDAVLNKIKDTADELNAVASEISKMKDPSQITEGQKSFIDNVLGKFGNKDIGKNFEQLFANAAGDTGMMADNLMNCAEGMEGMAAGAANVIAIVDIVVKSVDATIRGIAQIRDQLNAMRSDSRQMEGWGWDVFEYLENFNKYAASGWEKLKSGDVIGAATDTISSIISIFGTAQSQKVKRLDKEIKKLGYDIEDLEYSFSRLQKAQEKLFGSDYIQNYNQQLANLNAQAEAYLKQKQAEEAKGKGADDDKIREYGKQWRETLDEIKDMRDELVNYFAGTDITSAARDFANSWLDARWAFEDTTEAMREKFADMVQNMVVESMAARLMQNILDPIYKMIDDATADNEITAQEIAAISAKAYGSIGMMNNAMETMLAQLEAAGMDLSQMFSEGGSQLTGITRDYATASEESINGLAQGVNTQNYYLSYVPSIGENVAAIRVLMEGGAVAAIGGGDYNSLANEHLAQLPVIAANTLATAERCERAAVACEEMRDYIARVVVSKANGFALNTRLLN